MSELPGRWYLENFEPERGQTFSPIQGMHVCAGGGEFVRTDDYVALESRLREVEAERDASDGALQDVIADLAALVPLAALGLLSADTGSYWPTKAIQLGLRRWDGIQTEKLVAARAVLARMEGA